jgi:ribosome-interacting GTPase 1
MIELFDCPAVEIPTEFRHGKPGLLAVTHADVAGADEMAALSELAGGRLAMCGLDCTTGAGFDQFGQNIWRLMHVIRVYTKRPGHKAKRTDPFTLPVGSTVEDLARGIHRDLPGKLKFARIWGDGRYAGQQVHRTECLRDKDLVEIHE